jgi:tRNA dimethylallyltransferase
VAGTALALLGPTASGKSSLAIKLAERLPVEIVSLDSALVYRGMDIGTAKPGAALRASVPHHLIDIVDPDQSYSAGRWREQAVAAVLDVLKRNRVPLIVGGTMLYYRALTTGMDALPQADARIRAEIDADAARRGWPALHADLARVDPQTAQRLAPADAQRIQRALEVWKLTGKPLSALHGAARAELPFALKGIVLLPERSVLHQRIAERFEGMLRLGLVDEVKALRKKYRLSAALPSMRAVGYRQVWEHLEGRSDVRAMKEKAIVATRQLAKRQFTWLRSFPDLARLEDTADPAGALERVVHSFL